MGIQCLQSFFHNYSLTHRSHTRPRHLQYTHQVTLQYALWDAWKEAAAPAGGSSGGRDGQLRRLVNAAGLTAGVLVAGALPLSILKVVGQEAIETQKKEGWMHLSDLKPVPATCNLCTVDPGQPMRLRLCPNKLSAGFPMLQPLQ